MTRFLLITAGFLMISMALNTAALNSAQAAERKLPIAGQQKSAPAEEELPPEAIPQIPNVPPEAFSLKGDCNKEEERALNAMDERFLDLSDPELVSMNRDQKETMEMLRDPDQLRKVIETYTKCGRTPSMHELDASTAEKDMEDLEKANR